MRTCIKKLQYQALGILSAKAKVNSDKLFKLQNLNLYYDHFYMAYY